MRHKIYGKHLGRDKNERASLFKNLIGSLIFNGSITTTEAKAKAIKGLVDKVVNRPQTFSLSKKIQDKLIKEVVPALKSRTSGYTSLIKLGPRQGDGAMIVKISLLLEEVKKKVSKK